MNSPTLALLRKDRPWLLGFLALGGLVSVLLFLDEGFSAVFVVPEHRFAETLVLLLAPLAVLFGLYSALGDRLRSMGDFLRHRPLSAGRIFWTRNVAAMLVIVAWMAFGTAYVWLRELLFGLGGAGADASRFGALAAMTAGLALDYAIVVFAFALPAHGWHRIWFAGVLLFSRYAVQSLLGPADPSLLLCALLPLLGTLVFLVAAARCEAAGHDADRPTPGVALVGAVGLTVVAASLFGAIAAGGWHKLALEGLQNTRPLIGQVGSDELGLLRHDYSEGLYIVLDARGAPTERRIPSNGSAHLAPRPKSPDFDPLGVPALYSPFGWYQSIPGSHLRRRVQLGRDHLRIVEESRGGRSCWSLPLPPETAGLSGAALVELEDGEEEPLFLFVPGAVGPWLLTAETPPRLIAQPLPDSERPQRTTWWADKADKNHRAIVGETRIWAYSAGVWNSVEDSHAERTPTFTVLDADALRPEVELTLPGGPTLRHRYGLEGVSRKLFAGFAALSTLLRPAPFAILGASSDYAAIAAAKPDEALLVLDSLLGGGYRWLLGLNLALTAGLMLMMFRELRGRGASPRRTLGWTLAAFLAGVFSGPLLLVLEPRRAWKRPAKSTPPAALIRAA